MKIFIYQALMIQSEFNYYFIFTFPSFWIIRDFKIVQKLGACRQISIRALVNTDEGSMDLRTWKMGRIHGMLDVFDLSG